MPSPEISVSKMCSVLSTYIKNIVFLCQQWISRAVMISAKGYFICTDRDTYKTQTFETVNKPTGLANKTTSLSRNNLDSF